MCVDRGAGALCPTVCVCVQEAEKKAAAQRKRQRKEKEKEAKPKRVKVRDHDINGSRSSNRNRTRHDDTPTVTQKTASTATKGSGQLVCSTDNACIQALFDSESSACRMQVSWLDGSHSRKREHRDVGHRVNRKTRPNLGCPPLG